MNAGNEKNVFFLQLWPTQWSYSRFARCKFPFILVEKQKAVIGSVENVFSRALFVCKMDHDFELFIMYWEVFGYMSLSVIRLALSILFLVSAILFYQGFQFRLPLKIGHNLLLWIVFVILCNWARIRCL